MKLTKAHFIGESLLRISGGVLTPDVTARWGEAETYFTMAVNYVQTGNYWLESKIEGAKTINPLLLTPFDNVAISYSTDNLQSYSILPSDVITISKGRALEITTMCGKLCYPLDQGDDALERFYGKLKTVISYRLEGPRKVWLYNLPPLIQGIRPKYIVEVNSLPDDAEILLPSDAQVKVVDMIVAFLNGELKEHKDYTEDAKTN